MTAKRRYGIITLVLTGSVILLLTANLLIGSSSFKGLKLSEELINTVVIQLRLPRAITALLVGGALGVCGLSLQTFFRNPLAGPSVLGITSGASLGVAIAVLGAGLFPFVESFSKSAQLTGAVAGAMGVTLLLSLIATFARSTATLLIVGLMLGLFISALISVLSLHTNSSSLKDFAIWGMGSFGALSLSIELITLIITSLAFVLFLWMRSSVLNTLFTGEVYAKSMGVNVKATRMEIILSTSILVGVITAYCGPIAFLGLATPHLIRLIFKSSNHFQLIPLSFLGGSCLALLADLAIKLPSAAYSLPLNSVLSLIGAPVVIYLILKKKAHLNL